MQTMPWTSSDTINRAILRTWSAGRYLRDVLQATGAQLDRPRRPVTRPAHPAFTRPGPARRALCPHFLDESQQAAIRLAHDGKRKLGRAALAAAAQLARVVGNA